MIFPKIQNVSRDEQLTVNVTSLSLILRLIFEIVYLSIRNLYLRFTHNRSDKNLAILQLLSW